MTNSTALPALHFHPLTLEDKKEIQDITLHSGLQNCNFTFANLFCWKFLFDTEVCLLPGIVIIRYLFSHRQPAYFINSPALPDKAVIDSLLRSENNALMLINVNDVWAAQLKQQYGDAVTVEPLRDSYDYIYRREELEQVRGKNLKAKRNHINKFISEHPAFEYRQLEPSMFDSCRRLEQLWRDEVRHDNPWYGNTIESEHRMIEEAFRHWEQLEMYGGAIFVDGQMTAFSFGAAVTDDTFDTCVEKANRSIDGAFNIINQQMALHLPPQFRYINREEDMGLEGLRKSKLSYHPDTLLSYNILTFRNL